MRNSITGVTFNDLGSSGTRISRSSEFSVVNSTELNRAKYTAQSAYFMNLEITDTIIVYVEIRKVDNNLQRYATRFL